MDSADFERARAAFLDGLQHLQAQRLVEAEASFEQSLSCLPGRPSTLTNLGAVRLMLGRPDDALPVLEQAAAAEPDHVEAWGHLGVAQARLGRDAQAVAAFDRALALQPDNAAVLFEAAAALGRLQRHAEALRCLDRLLAAQPGHAGGWTLRGSVLRELGRPLEAATAFDRALTHGGDEAMNRFFLAGLRAEAAMPGRPPEAYVRGLFDGYADEFDQHLVQVLKYRAHEHVARLLTRDRRRFKAVLDLGCGTGLLGPLLAPWAARIDGVDLSPPMLEQARRRGLYAQLEAADLVAHLQHTPRRYDAVAAADVFIYVGELGPVFAGMRRVVEAGGRVAFSVERGDPARAVELRPSLRYAHGEAGLRALAADHGFDVLRVENGPIREEQRHPIEGQYLLLQRRD